MIELLFTPESLEGRFPDTLNKYSQFARFCFYENLYCKKGESEPFLAQAIKCIALKCFSMHVACEPEAQTPGHLSLNSIHYSMCF